MAAAGLRRRADRVDPQPRGDVFQRGNQLSARSRSLECGILSDSQQFTEARRRKSRRRRRARSALGADWRSRIVARLARDSRRPAHDRRATIVVVVVQRSQAAEHASGLARQRDDPRVQTDARGRRLRSALRRASGTASRPDSSIRRQQRRAAIADRDVRARPDAPLAGRYAAADDALELVDRGRERATIVPRASPAARDTRRRAAAASAMASTVQRAPQSAARSATARSPAAAHRRRSRARRTNSFEPRRAHRRIGRRGRGSRAARAASASAGALREVVAIGRRRTARQEES